MTAFQIEGNGAGKRSIITQNQIFSFNDETARSTSFAEFKGRFNFLAGLFNHFHFVQLALTALRHIGSCNASFVTSNEVFQFSNFLLLAFVSSFLLRFVDCIHFLEAVVVAGVTGKVAVFQMVDYIYYAIKEANIMGDEDECVLIVLQEFSEPFDMFNVQIVGRFVQEQDVGVLEEQFSQKNFTALTTGKVCDVTVKTNATKAQAVSNFFDFSVEGVETAVFQFRLDFTNGVHHFIKFFRSSVAHFVIQVEHLLFHFVHALESSAQYFANGHAFFQSALLVKVTNAYFARPFNFTFVRL